MQMDKELSLSNQKGIETSFLNQKSTFTDSRDGKTYKTVKIGNQVWMAENLCYKPDSGNYWAYDNNQNNIITHGYLYDWQTSKEVCPSGWHLPDKREFEILLSEAGGSGSNAYHALEDGGSSGFSALLGGWRYGDGSFNDFGTYGSFWSSSEYDTGFAWLLDLNSGSHHATIYYGYEDAGLSVRCLQN
jgi:uncharacterized protein (TIGR02145 family)